MEKSKILEEKTISEKMAIQRENLKKFRHQQFIDNWEEKINLIDNLGRFKFWEGNGKQKI